MSQTDYQTFDLGDFALTEGATLRDAKLAFDLWDPERRTRQRDRRSDLVLRAPLGQRVENPSSHRQVDFDDPAEVVEVVLFADLLIRMLDRMSSARA